jgi:hypothetical protein
MSIGAFGPILLSAKDLLMQQQDDKPEPKQRAIRSIPRTRAIIFISGFQVPRRGLFVRNRYNSSREFTSYFHNAHNSRSFQLDQVVSLHRCQISKDWSAMQAISLIYSIPNVYLAFAPLKV